jgi:hypothetical protein
MTSWFFEITFVLVRFDHVASGVVNANHSIMSPAEKLCVADCVADRVWLAIPQPTEWERIGDQIDAAMITAGDFVNMLVAI